MKDMVEQIYDELNAQVVRMLEHGLKQSARIAELDARLDAVLNQLPDGMEKCTIQFKECEHGHGTLTATNWIQHPCQTCRINELERENSSLAYELNVALSGGSVSIPAADTDKLREALDTDSAHSAIMNMPCKSTMSHFATRSDWLLYAEGHRDARHAAAELVGSMAGQAPVHEVPEGCTEPYRKNCPRHCMDFCNKAEQDLVVTATPIAQDVDTNGLPG